MQVKTRAVARVVVVVTLGYLTYRGILSFLRNEVTVNITELVHLPASERLLEMDDRALLQGEIQCETYLMRSYRFLIKLAANVEVPSTTPPPSSRSRHRVVRANESGSYRTMASHVESKKREGIPTICVEDINSMVDFWELAHSGNISFTPPCIGDELLMRYRAPGISGQGINAVVKNCYLQPDETPGLKRLSFDLIVHDIVHGAKIHIKLPNRYCDVISIHTGGVGTIQQPNRRKPHHFVWDVGTVDETTWKKVKPVSPEVFPEGRLARRGFTDDDLAATVERQKSSDAVGAMVKNYIPPDAMDIGLDGRNDENDDAFFDDGSSGFACPLKSSGLPEGTQLLIARFYLVYEEPDGMECDYVSTDSEMSGGEEECADSESRSRKGNRQFSSRAAETSRKAAKREERSRVRKAKRAAAAARADAVLTAGKGLCPRAPVVELSYSVVGLVSGISVRRLQTVSDKPNWIPRSILDSWLLRWVIPGISQLQLGKFGHYTSWFVQPVVVATF